MSTGWSKLGLYPTRNWPNDIWFSMRKLATDHKNQQVRLDRIGLISGRIEWRCFRRFLLGGDLYFSSDLCWICAKLTRSEKKKIKSSDLCKTHEIWAKKHQIVTGLSKTHWSFVGFEQNPTYFHWIWALVEQNPLWVCLDWTYCCWKLKTL